MQDEQKKFQEKLSELLSYARNHENKVTMKEVRDFFEDFALDEQKVTFVCEYLTMEQVDVADYEPGVVPEETEKEKKKPLFLELFLICRRIKVRCGTNQVAFIMEASSLDGQGLKWFMPFLRE